MTTPTVSVSGIDNLLLQVEGIFSTSLDEKILNRTGKFAGSLDRAAKKIFRSMADGVELQGNIRASSIMGTNVKIPGFLQEFTPNEQKWEPLTKSYLRRKKKLVGLGAIKTKNTWQYSGDLKALFRKKSEEFTKISGNTFANKSYYDTQTNSYASRRYSKRNPEDTLFLAIPAIGKGLGTSSLNYDFVYIGTSLNVKYDSKHKTNPNNYAKAQYVNRMKRSVSFSVFDGLHKYMMGMLQGDSTGLSPEDFIKDISLKSKKLVFHNKPIKGKNYTFEVDKAAKSNPYLRNKLYYYVGEKRAIRKQRGLIQPYMMYYAKKVMYPLAEKLIREGRY